MADPNILYERHRFYQRCQRSEETLQSFVDDIVNLAAGCGFGRNVRSAVRDRVLFGLSDEDRKWRIINGGGDPTLDDVITAHDSFESILKVEIDEKPFCLDELQPCEAKPLTIMETAPLLVELSPSPKSTKKPKTSSSEVSKVSEQKQRIASTVRDDDRECPTCHRMIRPENYGAHINSHSTGLKIVKIICHNCDTIFESYLELNAHYESQHTEFDPEMKRMKYFCSRCDTSYVKLSKLRIHLTHKHNRPPARIFECRACGITFTAMHEINDHIKVHTTCDICSEVCRSEVALRVHMLSHGDDEHPFECFVCHSTFGKINFLRIHTKYAHAVDVFRCTQCNAEFDRRQKLQVHRRTHHNGDVLRCEVCDRLLDQLGDYEEHLRVHPQCDLCGKRLKTKLQVWRHRLSHIAVEPFECYECHHRCRSFAQLKKHSHKHHTEAAIRRKLTTNPPKEHLCAQCGACFVKAMLLRKHLMREDHRKAGVGIDKPFECDVCQKRFSKSTSLKEHYRHHTGEKPYACEFCDKRFRSTTGLGEHRQGVHLQRDRFKCQFCDFKCFKSSGMKKHMRKHVVT